ncbi:MAG TPA: preprotein translocase subunit YajC [Clostridia bacterium]|nr:preprotein translocase subunit YajC [Clostridia bacterium]
MGLLFLEDAAQQPYSPWVSFGMLAVFVAIFYFFLIRPQQKKAKQVKQMLDALKVGDRVRTIGGMFGTIVELKDDIAVIEAGYENKVKLAFVRSAIAQVNDEGVEGDSIQQ